EAENRQKERDKQLRALPKPNEKVFEITLKQTSLPGLPPPLQKTNGVAKLPDSPVWQDLSHQPVVSGGTLSAAQNSDTARVTPTDPDDAEKPSMPDADLNEAKRILIDYILLRSPDNAISGMVNKPTG